MLAWLQCTLYITDIVSVTSITHSLILGKLHIDNRLIYLIGALLLIAGSSILGDWQSIGGDPCNQFNNNLTLPADNVTIQLVAPFNGTPTTLTVTDCDTRCDTSLCDQLTRISDSLGPDSTVCVQLDDDEMQQLLQCVWTNMFLTLDTAAQQWETESSGAHDGTVFLVFRIISNNTLSCELSSCDSSSNHTTTSECVCQAYSSVPGYSCFWNQISRVTREHCDTCLPTCLSRTHSLYFAQFIAALIFFSPIYPIGRLSLTFIMSDCASGQSQVSSYCSPIQASSCLLAHAGTSDGYSNSSRCYRQSNRTIMGWVVTLWGGYSHIMGWVVTLWGG